jgi:hypothetical protein
VPVANRKIGSTVQPAASLKGINRRKEFSIMGVVIILLALIAYMGFHQWMKHHRRVMIHRERLAAVEKGVTLPPLDQEVRRSAWNVQRILLLAGLIWIAIGLSAFVILSALLAYPSEASERIPRGMQWIGVAPAAIGVSHLIVYLVGKNKER